MDEVALEKAKVASRLSNAVAPSCRKDQVNAEIFTAHNIPLVSLYGLTREFLFLGNL